MASSGYTIAQLPVEDVSGRNLAGFVRDEGLLPLDMSSADFDHGGDNDPGTGGIRARAK